MTALFTEFEQCVLQINTEFRNYYANDSFYRDLVRNIFEEFRFSNKSIKSELETVIKKSSDWYRIAFDHLKKEKVDNSAFHEQRYDTFDQTLFAYLRFLEQVSPENSELIRNELTIANVTEDYNYTSLFSSTPQSPPSAPTAQELASIEKFSNNRFGVHYLKLMLEDDYASENILFSYSVNVFKKANDSKKAQIIGSYIFNNFINECAPNEINVNTEVVANLFEENAKKKFTKTSFDEAQKEIILLMNQNNVMFNFKNSAYFQKMTNRFSPLKIPRLEKKSNVKTLLDVSFATEDYRDEIPPTFAEILENSELLADFKHFMMATDKNNPYSLYRAIINLNANHKNQTRDNCLRIYEKHIKGPSGQRFFSEQLIHSFLSELSVSSDYSLIFKDIQDEVISNMENKYYQKYLAGKTWVAIKSAKIFHSSTSKPILGRKHSIRKTDLCSPLASNNSSQSHSGNSSHSSSSSNRPSSANVFVIPKGTPSTLKSFNKSDLGLLQTAEAEMQKKSIPNSRHNPIQINDFAFNMIVDIAPPPFPPTINDDLFSPPQTNSAYETTNFSHIPPPPLNHSVSSSSLMNRDSFHSPILPPSDDSQSDYISPPPLSQLSQHPSATRSQNRSSLNCLTQRENSPILSKSFEPQSLDFFSGTSTPSPPFVVNSTPPPPLKFSFVSHENAAPLSITPRSINGNSTLPFSRRAAHTKLSSSEELKSPREESTKQSSSLDVNKNVPFMLSADYDSEQLEFINKFQFYWKTIYDFLTGTVNPKLENLICRITAVQSIEEIAKNTDDVRSLYAIRDILKKIELPHRLSVLFVKSSYDQSNIRVSTFKAKMEKIIFIIQSKLTYMLETQLKHFHSDNFELFYSDYNMLKIHLDVLNKLKELSLFNS